MKRTHVFPLTLSTSTNADSLWTHHISVQTRSRNKQQAVSLAVFNLVDEGLFYVDRNLGADGSIDPFTFASTVITYFKSFKTVPTPCNHFRGQSTAWVHTCDIEHQKMISHRPLEHERDSHTIFKQKQPENGMTKQRIRPSRRRYTLSSWKRSRSDFSKYD